MHRHFGQPAAFQEGDSIGVLERITAGAPDQVRAEEHEYLVDRDVPRDIAGHRDGDIRAKDQQVAAERGAKGEPEHRIKIKRREQ